MAKHKQRKQSTNVTVHKIDKAESKRFSKEQNTEIPFNDVLPYIFYLIIIMIGLAIISLQLLRPHVNNYYSSESDSFEIAVKTLQTKVTILEKRLEGEITPELEKLSNDIKDVKRETKDQGDHFESRILNVRSEVTEGAVKIRHYDNIINDMERESKLLKSDMGDLQSVFQKQNIAVKNESTVSKVIGTLQVHIENLNVTFKEFLKVSKKDKKTLLSKVKNLEEITNQDQMKIRRLDESLETMTTKITNSQNHVNAELKRTNLSIASSFYHLTVLRKLAKKNTIRTERLVVQTSESRTKFTKQVTRVEKRLNRIEKRSGRLQESVYSRLVTLNDNIKTLQHQSRYQAVQYKTMVNYTSRLEYRLKNTNKQVMEVNRQQLSVENKAVNIFHNITAKFVHLNQTVSLKLGELSKVKNVTYDNRQRLMIWNTQHFKRMRNLDRKVYMTANRLVMFENYQKHLRVTLHDKNVMFCKKALAIHKSLETLTKETQRDNLVRINSKLEKLDEDVDRNRIKTCRLVQAVANTTECVLTNFNGIAGDIVYLNRSLETLRQLFDRPGTGSVTNVTKNFGSNSHLPIIEIVFDRINKIQENQKRLVKHVRDGYAATIHSMKVYQNQSDHVTIHYDVLLNYTKRLQDRLEGIQYQLYRRQVANHKTVDKHNELMWMKTYKNYLQRILSRQLDKFKMEVIWNRRYSMISDKHLKENIHLNRSFVPTSCNDNTMNMGAGLSTSVPIIRNLNALTKKCFLKSDYARRLAMDALKKTQRVDSNQKFPNDYVQRYSLTSAIGSILSGESFNASISEMVSVEMEPLRRLVDFRGSMIENRLKKLGNIMYGDANKARSMDTKIRAKVELRLSLLEKQMETLDHQLKVDNSLSYGVHRGGRMRQNRSSNYQIVKKYQNCNDTVFEPDIFSNTFQQTNIHTTSKVGTETSHRRCRNVVNDDIQIHLNLLSDKIAHVSDKLAMIPKLFKNARFEFKRLLEKQLEKVVIVLKQQRKLCRRTASIGGMKHFNNVTKVQDEFNALFTNMEHRLSNHISYDTMQHYVDARIHSHHQRISRSIQKTQHIKTDSDTRLEQLSRDASKFIMFVHSLVNQQLRSVMEKLKNQNKTVSRSIEDEHSAINRYLVFHNGLYEHRFKHFGKYMQKLEGKQAKMEATLRRVTDFYLSPSHKASQMSTMRGLHRIEQKQELFRNLTTKHYGSLTTTLSDLKKSLKEQGKKTAYIIKKLRNQMNYTLINMESEMATLYDTTGMLVKHTRMDKAQQQRQMNYIQRVNNSNKKTLDELTSKLLSTSMANEFRKVNSKHYEPGKMTAGNMKTGVN
ncbi:centromere-associated protein E-like [Ptychodera flava]|uniref:centromere-associated protein E-like n=1 Tax=Ptychodera flava TaxID=63121 RepID=UPI003969CCC4